MSTASDDIVVQDREELIYLLCEAAEFEHTVMCSYLYAQWTLKRGLDEDVTPTELAAIERWRRSLGRVALEEMLHLSLVNNLLAAIGAAPHLWRPAFPVRPGHFPADVVMTLMPFGDAALDHFMFIERPEGLDIADGAGFSRFFRCSAARRNFLYPPAVRNQRDAVWCLSFCCLCHIHLLSIVLLPPTALFVSPSSSPP